MIINDEESQMPANKKQTGKSAASESSRELRSPKSTAGQRKVA